MRTETAGATLRELSKRDECDPSSFHPFIPALAEHLLCARGWGELGGRVTVRGGGITLAPEFLITVQLLGLRAGLGTARWMKAGWMPAGTNEQVSTE